MKAVAGSLAVGLVGLLLVATGHGCGSSNDANSLDAGADTSTDAGTLPAIPLDPTSPWPKFRANARQDGRSSVRPNKTGAFWSYKTGKGIFSSPVVAGDGTIFVGSADRTFYALNPDGTLLWKLLTGEIIDSSALLDDQGKVYFGSGDGKLRALEAKTGKPVWTFAADDPAVNKAFINWFEGNVAIGPSGQLYVPNDNFFVYAIDRTTGAAVWKFKMPDQTWSSPAIDPTNETLFIGNNNTLPALGKNVFAIRKDKDIDWATNTLGTVAASPMIAGELVVVGSFDGYLRAYDRISGEEKWSFATRDHLYASPGLLPDGTIIQPSCDGTLYAIEPKTGSLRWAFDTREPLRSSPAIDADGTIYVGSGEGRLFVVTKDGSLKWSVRLITDPRDDLNASPALGKDAIYVAGESGEIFSVPYDYCTLPLAAPKGCAFGKENLPPDGAILAYTTAFGALLIDGDSETPTAGSPNIDGNQPIVFSLLVREKGDTKLAVLDTRGVKATTDKGITLSVDVAGDGKFLVVTPTSPLPTGPLTVTIEGNYLVGFKREGLKLSGGTIGGTLKKTFNFTVHPRDVAPPSLATKPGETRAFELSRLALPLPTIMPSYNQIGFDSLHYVISIVESDGKTGVAWMVGAKLVEGEARTIVDPDTKALVPLRVEVDGDLVRLQNEDGLKVEVMNAIIPFRTFGIAARLSKGFVALETARMSGSTICASVPFYGPFLERLGLCHPLTNVLTVAGAAKLGPFGTGIVKSAPVGDLKFQAFADHVEVTIDKSTLNAKDHVTALLLLDDKGLPVTLDYGLETVRIVTAEKVTKVTIPFGKKAVPKSLRAHLMVDASTVGSANLSVP